MSDRKLSDLEVEAHNAGQLLLRAIVQPHPVEAMQAVAMLNRLANRVHNLENSLAFEQRQHRDTERRLKEAKTERDVARRERDERARA